MVVVEDVDRESAIERILLYLSLADPEPEESDHERQILNWNQVSVEKQKRFSEWQKLPLRYFDRAQPFAYLSLMFLTESYDRELWDLDDPELHRLPLLGWDATTLGIDCNGPEKGKRIGHQYLYSMQRVRQVPLREVRGLFRPYSTQIAERSIADIFSDGTYTCERVYIEWRGGRWWYVGLPYSISPVPVEPLAQSAPWMHKSLALTTEYDWQVQLGYNFSQLPTIALVTDPIGSKDIFKLRDVPKGRSRREALRNWVSGHWRKGSNADNPEVHIWPYLRGAEEFTWNGLYCKIQPSVYDLRKSKEYQERAVKQKAKAKR